MPAGNVSNEARKARYAALESWCDDRNIDWLMTAHHADDQLETMIMRLNRGSGVAGLSGIRARQGRIVRPLLRWRHDELVALLDDMGVEAVDDPTNHDDAYDRARLRKKMREIDMFDARAAAISLVPSAKVFVDTGLLRQGVRPWIALGVGTTGHDHGPCFEESARVTPVPPPPAPSDAPPAAS